MKDWKKTLVTPETPIFEALKIIDQAALKIALVADEQGKLLGTVTDGDVRRALIRNISLQSPISGIMNASPTTARQNEKKKQILAAMKEKSLRQIPLLDAAGRVVGIEAFEELLASKTRDNWVVLMAGGLGKRLAPLTDDCPKPMLKVGGKPILETIITRFVECGFKKIFLAVNYKAEMIQEHFGDGSKFHCEIIYLHEQQQMGTAGALTLLPEKPPDSLIVMNGDLLTKVAFDQLIDFHDESQAIGTMCVREYEFQVPYGVVQIDEERITGISEKPVHKFFVSAGINVFDSEVYDWIPKNERYDMPQLFEEILKRNGKTAVYPIREYWIDIGRFDDLERAQGDYKGFFE